MRYPLPMLMLFASLAHADGQEVATRLKDAVFSAAEQTLIRTYFERRPEALEALSTEKNGAEREEAESSRQGKPEKGGKGEKKAKGEKKGNGLPPGLAKRGTLPPGLSRKLERDGQLPPGLERRALPADLERKLPPAPEGSERVVVDGDVVLVETATGVIRDIIRDVLDATR